MRYATIPTLEARLKNRLELLGTGTQSFGKSLGANQVDSAFLEQIASEIEADIDATLASIYVLPIDPITAPDAILILRSIAEEFTINKVVQTFFNLTMNPQAGGDANFGQTYYQDAIDKLEKYTAGYGVYYRKGVTSGNRLGNQIQQPIPLPGVKLRVNVNDTRTIQPFDAIAVSVEYASKIDWGI